MYPSDPRRKLPVLQDATGAVSAGGHHLIAILARPTHRAWTERSFHREPFDLEEIRAYVV